MFRTDFKKYLFYAGTFSALLLAGCSNAAQDGLHRVGADKESGFLKDVSNLKPNAKLGPEILTYVNQDQAKQLRRYVAVVVDPVQVYLASDADPSQLQTKAGTALAQYFERALKDAVGDAFPIVDQPGPLVLRLRAAIVGVGVGSQQTKSDDSTKPFERAAKIDQVHIELELVDSQTGERIAAAVDRAALGTNAEVGAMHFERVEKFVAAKEALDEWATRVREFLDAEHELNPADAARSADSYTSYNDGREK